MADTTEKLSREDAEVFRLLEDAGRQYQRYLEVAQLADLGKLASESSKRQEPFRPAPLSLAFGARNR